MERIGVFLSLGHEKTLQELTTAAQAVDRAGADVLWVGEDYYNADAFALLGAVAAVTTHAQLGMGVTHPYTRNPALLAMGAATIDRFSGGRFILGLGRGLPTIIERQMGIPYGKPLAIMAEVTEILRKLWAGETVGASGYYTLNNVALAVPPSRPRIPIYFGVIGPAALRLAGRIADGVLLIGWGTVQYVEWAVQQIRRGAAEAQRDPGEIEVALILWGFQVTDKPEERLAALKSFAALFLALPGYEALLQHSSFSPDILPPLRRALKVEELLAQGLEPYLHSLRVGNVAEAVKHIPDDLVRAMCVIGPEGECRVRLQEYRAAGVQQVVLNAIGEDIKTVVESIKRVRSWR